MVYPFRLVITANSPTLDTWSTLVMTNPKSYLGTNSTIGKWANGIRGRGKVEVIYYVNFCSISREIFSAPKGGPCKNARQGNLHSLWNLSYFYNLLSLFEGVGEMVRSGWGLLPRCGIHPLATISCDWLALDIASPMVPSHLV